MHKQRMALMLAAAAGMVATFLPWATIMGMSITGTVGDGWISLGIFAIILILSVLGNRSLPLKGGGFAGVLILALLGVAMGVYEIMNIQKSGGEYVQIGIGLYLLLAAAALCALIPFLLKGGSNSPS